MTCFRPLFPNRSYWNLLVLTPPCIRYLQKVKTMPFLELLLPKILHQGDILQQIMYTNWVGFGVHTLKNCYNYLGPIWASSSPTATMRNLETNHSYIITHRHNHHNDLISGSNRVIYCSLLLFVWCLILMYTQQPCIIAENCKCDFDSLSLFCIFILWNLDLMYIFFVITQAT